MTKRVYSIIFLIIIMIGFLVWSSTNQKSNTKNSNKVSNSTTESEKTKFTIRADGLFYDSKDITEFDKFNNLTKISLATAALGSNVNFIYKYDNDQVTSINCISKNDKNGKSSTIDTKVNIAYNENGTFNKVVLEQNQYGAISEVENTYYYDDNDSRLSSIISVWKDHINPVVETYKTTFAYSEINNEKVVIIKSFFGLEMTSKKVLFLNSIYNGSNILLKLAFDDENWGFVNIGGRFNVNYFRDGYGIPSITGKCYSTDSYSTFQDDRYTKYSYNKEGLLTEQNTNNKIDSRWSYPDKNTVIWDAISIEIKHKYKVIYENDKIVGYEEE